MKSHTNNQVAQDFVALFNDLIAFAQQIKAEIDVQIRLETTQVGQNKKNAADLDKFNEIQVTLNQICEKIQILMNETSRLDDLSLGLNDFQNIHEKISKQIVALEREFNYLNYLLLSTPQKVVFYIFNAILLTATLALSFAIQILTAVGVGIGVTAFAGPVAGFIAGTLAALTIGLMPSLYLLRFAEFCKNAILDAFSGYNQQELTNTVLTRNEHQRGTITTKEETITSVNQFSKLMRFNLFGAKQNICQLQKEVIDRHNDKVAAFKLASA